MKFLRCVFNTMPRRGGLLPFLGVLIALAATACEKIYDGEADCVGGVNLRFVYDYHMEPNANAFTSNVDCISVFVFDNEGNYLTHYSETSAVLQNESYRMELPLDPGVYNLVVYGGLTCDNSIFELAPRWENLSTVSSKQADMTVTLPLDQNAVSDKKLHDIEERTGGLFYGTRQITISEEDLNRQGFREETVYMMKDTNNIQIILQELEDPYIIDVADYDFKIVDDNFVLDAQNRVREIAADDFQPIYKPYFTENRQMGYVEYIPRDGAVAEEDAERPVQVACAEFSTSRLVVEHLSTAKLVISDSKSGQEIINLPLILYLTAIRGMGDNWIKSDQEFLDRQSRWNMMLFLQNGKWSNTNIRIAVNAWIVRINNAEF